MGGMSSVLPNCPVRKGSDKVLGFSMSYSLLAAPRAGSESPAPLMTKLPGSGPEISRLSSRRDNLLLRLRHKQKMMIAITAKKSKAEIRAASRTVVFWFIPPVSWPLLPVGAVLAEAVGSPVPIVVEELWPVGTATIVKFWPSTAPEASDLTNTAIVILWSDSDVGTSPENVREVGSKVIQSAGGRGFVITCMSEEFQRCGFKSKEKCPPNSTLTSVSVSRNRPAETCI